MFKSFYKDCNFLIIPTINYFLLNSIFILKMAQKNETDLIQNKEIKVLI